MFMSKSKGAPSRLLLAKRVGLNMEVALQKCLRVKVETSTQLCLLWKGIQLEFNCHSTKFFLFLYHYKSNIFFWPSRTFPDPIIMYLIFSTLPSTLSNTQVQFYKLFSYKILFLLCCILPRKTFSELLSQQSVLSCLQIPKKIFFLIKIAHSSKQK